VSPVRLRALEEIGWLAWRRGEFERARRTLESALTKASEAGIDPPAGVLNNLGATLMCEDRFDEAQRQLERALQCDGASAGALATSVTFMAWVAYFRGDLDRAQDCAERLMVMSESVGYSLGAAWAVGLLGQISVDRGDLAIAARHLQIGMTKLNELGDQTTVLYAFEAVICLAEARSRFEEALRLAGSVASLRDQYGVRPAPAWERRLRRSIDRAIQAVGSHAAVAAMEDGRKTPLNSVAAYALQMLTSERS
jgi:tetratricopeptide (TPR) repeat protein